MKFNTKNILRKIVVFVIVSMLLTVFSFPVSAANENSAVTDIIKNIMNNSMDNRTVLTFDGRNISTADFNIFLLVNQGESDPKVSAVDMLEQYLVLEKAAKDRNITLTADELKQAKADALDLQSAINEYFPNVKNISIDFLQEIASVNYLYAKLLDAVAIEQGYTFDEKDFQTALADYIANGKQDYLQMDFKYIVTDSADTTAEAKKAIENGTLSADNAIKQYSTYYDEASGIQTINLADITFLSAEDLNNLMSLESGGVSNVIDLGDGEYVIFIADSVYTPTQDEIAASFKAMYENSKKSDIFNAEFTKWQADAQPHIKVNQSNLDNIDLTTLYGTN
ncbi:MAG: hypothetical protein FWD71_01115 [Oscillospiraceae bacterium]|nr:hypothetical protein [Oscillospiraceae bacterium]